MLIVAGSRTPVAAAAREGRRRTLEASVTDCCKRWAEDYPNELVWVKQVTQMLRETSRKSDEGTMVQRGKVPMTLYQRMCREVDRNWLNTYEIRKVFFDVFKVGLITKGGEQRGARND